MLRLRPHLVILAFLAGASSTLAREPRVFIGAATRLTATIDAARATETREVLQATEAALAEDLIRALDIEYLDRVHMDALFAELKLSAAGAFDPTTGAAPGLLGRIDFLVIAEAALPTTVRLRAIDVESGAVKATAVCEATPGWFGGSSFDYPACVGPFAAQTIAVARQRLASKKIAAQQAAEEARRQEQARVEAERGREEARMEAERRQEEADAAEALEREQARAAADARAREAQQQQAALQQQVDRLRPDYENALSRVSVEIRFWDEMEAMMAATGERFRPEIEVARSNAAAKIDECGFYFDHTQPGKLQACITQLEQAATRLKSFH